MGQDCRLSATHRTFGRYDSVDIMLKRILGAKANRERPATAVRRGPDLHEFGCSDEDLFYVLFGVPDRRMIGKLQRPNPAQ
jgi:hypothetical protein